MRNVNEPVHLKAAFAIARRLELFADFRVLDSLQKLPDWLRVFQEVDGFELFERQHNISIPTALKEFWSFPELVCAWELTGLCPYDKPKVETFTTGKYLTFDFLPHSNEPAMVLLNGAADPPVVLGFTLYDADAMPPEERGKIHAEKFSQYLADGFTNFAQRNNRV